MTLAYDPRRERERAGKDWRGAAVTSAPGSMVEVVQRLHEGFARVRAQASVCAYLVVVPEVSGGFTGGFTALHVPTGLVLKPAALLGLTPDEVDTAICAVAGLDWSRADRDFYNAEDSEHRRAWHEAVLDVVRPGGSSAKTSHRAGSPNHQNDSKENPPIVGRLAGVGGDGWAGGAR
ncbi:hypothetical protein [Pseudonocardia acaciae]|uniref:hypothetical protein n=1 Tax=Pseudonocardia acaciae TaxID=551276 RepID=UPI000490668E|nr:hypothetical protein [Pseudonocardia acaciae]